jgi:hypothetical protein
MIYTSNMKVNMNIVYIYGTQFPSKNAKNSLTIETKNKKEREKEIIQHISSI